MECYSVADGETAHEERFGVSFDGLVIPFGARAKVPPEIIVGHLSHGPEVCWEQIWEIWKLGIDG